MQGGLGQRQALSVGVQAQIGRMGDENGKHPNRDDQPTYPLYHGHLRLVCYPATFCIGPVAVTEFTVRVLVEVRVHRTVVTLVQRGVESGDVFSEEGRHGLAHELGSNRRDSGMRFLLEPEAVTVILRRVVGVCRHNIGVG